MLFSQASALKKNVLTAGVRRQMEEKQFFN